MNRFISLYLVWIILMTTACSDPLTPEQQAERDCDNQILAYLMTQKFVAAQIKSPTTAVFPEYGGQGIEATYIGNCTHEIVGYVDSQNGFGATVRTQYLAKVQLQKSNNMWSLADLIIR